MRGPKPGGDIFDRQLECEEDLEAMANRLVDLAVASGWSELEVCIALQSLMDHRLLSSAANDETNNQIRRALDRLTGRGAGRRS